MCYNNYIHKYMQGDVCFQKEHAEYISLFLVRGKVLSVSKARTLEIQLQKNKLLTAKLVRSLGIAPKLTNKLSHILEQSGLQRSQLKLVISFIKEMFRSLSSDMYCPISLDRVMPLWNSLPNELREFILAVKLLKDEIVHLFFLRQRDNEARIMKRNCDIGNELSLNDFAKDVELYKNKRGYFLPQVVLNREMLADPQIHQHSSVLLSNVKGVYNNHDYYKKEELSKKTTNSD